MSINLPLLRERLSEGLIEQARTAGVTLTLQREVELAGPSNLALTGLQSVVGGTINPDWAQIFVGERSGLRLSLVCPLSVHLQGPGEFYFWLEGAPPQPLQVRSLSIWQRAFPLLRYLLSPSFESARGHATPLGVRSTAALARTSRHARTGLAIWHVPWFAQLFSVGEGRSVLVLKALPAGADWRAGFPMKKIPFAGACDLAQAIQEDLAPGPADRQAPLGPPEFSLLLQ